MNATFTVSETTIAENWPGLCAKTYSYTVSGNTITTTVTSNGCTFEGSNEPVGYVGVSNFEINGNMLTLRVPSTGAVATMIRVS